MTDKQIEFLDLQLGMIKLAETMALDEMLKDERAQDYMERMNNLTVEMGFECFKELHMLGHTLVGYVKQVLEMGEAISRVDTGASSVVS